MNNQRLIDGKEISLLIFGEHSAKEVAQIVMEKVLEINEEAGAIIDEDARD
jgi:hypothetical protein